MTRNAALGGVIVRCDYLFDSAHKADGHGRFCSAEFRSASVKAIIPQQLAIAGWTHRTTQRDGMQDFCPDHREILTMDESPERKRARQEEMSRWLARRGLG